MIDIFQPWYWVVAVAIGIPFLTYLWYLFIVGAYVDKLPMQKGDYIVFILLNLIILLASFAWIAVIVFGSIIGMVCLIYTLIRKWNEH